MIDTDSPGLTFKLHEGVEGAAGRTPTPPAKTTPLSEADIQKILARLAPMKGAATDQKEFALRERSLPAPRTGETVKTSFPPPQTAPAPDPTEAGPLKVLRHSPDGEVPLAPRLSVTFSQPMVAITSYAELEKLAPPVTITPQPTGGRWRWIGTKTVLFEAAGELERLPMATTYTVEIPAGTKSATGAALAAVERFSFATPPPQVVSFYPQDGPTTREPLVFAQFDQRIDPQAVLSTIHAQANGQDVKMRLATADEVKGDATITSFITAQDADGHQQRYLAFRPSSPLPVDSQVTVSVGPGTPSAEGPRKTEKSQDYSFHTYGAMRITDQSCKGDREDECPPYSGFWVELSNPIDGKTFDKSMVTVDPPISGLKVVGRGNSINLTGATKGRSTYKATFSSRIPDVFGQTLGKDEVITFKTGKAQKRCSPPAASSWSSIPSPRRVTRSTRSTTTRSR